MNNNENRVKGFVGVTSKGKRIEVINLTSHTIVDTQTQKKIRPSGLVARVERSIIEYDDIGGIPLMTEEYGTISGLPKPRPGVIYITSVIVLKWTKITGTRTDIYSPGKATRDKRNVPISCNGLNNFA